MHEPSKGPTPRPSPPGGDSAALDEIRDILRRLETQLCPRPRRRPTTALKLAIDLLIGVPLMYVASCGPVCTWVAQSIRAPEAPESISLAYGPILWTAKRFPPFSHAIKWYGSYWVESGGRAVFWIARDSGEMFILAIKGHDH